MDHHQQVGNRLGHPPPPDGDLMETAFPQGFDNSEAHLKPLLGALGLFPMLVPVGDVYAMATRTFTTGLVQDGLYIFIDEHGGYVF
mmetsp:Transcript_12275/g.22876  ORF Transcript_12275/g.22876 Transcript_12275/m.22876 type:complete len:86 (+) Transcript_12275:119-376(+)